MLSKHNQSNNQKFTGDHNDKKIHNQDEETERRTERRNRNGTEPEQQAETKLRGLERNRTKEPKRQTERRILMVYSVCTVRNTVRVEIIPIKNTESQLIYIISLLIKKRIEPLPFLLL